MEKTKSKKVMKEQTTQVTTVDARMVNLSERLQVIRGEAAAQNSPAVAVKAAPQKRLNAPKTKNSAKKRYNGEEVQAALASLLKTMTANSSQN